MYVKTHCHKKRKCHNCGICVVFKVIFVMRDLQGCGCEEQEPRNYYCYYDTPEGCDIGKKMFVTSKYAAIAGVIMSTHDVILYSHAKGWGPILRRYAFHTVPLVLMGATFSAVANNLHNYREKDDHLNYFIGGLACGPILGYYMGSIHAVVLGGLALGIAGAIKKDSILKHYALIPRVEPFRGSIRSWRHDFTILSDPKDDLIHTCGKESEP